MAFAERNSQSNEPGFRDLLAVQHGLAMHAQLAALGMSPSGITHRIARGDLERVLPRVYRSPLVPRTVAQSALAAVLWGGEGSVASHRTAAAIWGIEGVPQGSPVELWIPRSRASRGGVTVHRGDVTGNDRRLRDRVPVTSPARTIVDLAGLRDAEVLEAAVEDVLHRGLTTASTLDRRLAALGGSGRVGAGRLSRVLADRDQAPLESRLEVKVWRLLRGAGFRPVRQFRVRRDGDAYRLDFAWPRLKVAVEADGYRAHGGKVALAADGWRIVPVTWEDCTNEPHVFLDRVRSALLRA